MKSLNVAELIAKAKGLPADVVSQVIAANSGREFLMESTRVAEAVVQAEQALADLKRMQEIFAQHPEFEELLTLVQRGRV